MPVAGATAAGGGRARASSSSSARGRPRKRKCASSSSSSSSSSRKAAKQRKQTRRSPTPQAKRKAAVGQASSSCSSSSAKRRTARVATRKARAKAASSSASPTRSGESSGDDADAAGVLNAAAAADAEVHSSRHTKTCSGKEKSEDQRRRVIPEGVFEAAGEKQLLLQRASSKGEAKSIAESAQVPPRRPPKSSTTSAAAAAPASTGSGGRQSGRRRASGFSDFPPPRVSAQPTAANGRSAMAALQQAPLQQPPPPPGAPPPLKKPGLGDLAALQKSLEAERGRLQLFVIKAKQELEEKNESIERRERREKEYYKAASGEPCGPNNRFLVEGELGKGAFSTVFKCRDVAARDGSAQEFAVKFVRMNTMLRQATEKEVKMYRRLRNEASVADADGAKFLMNLAACETFEHHGHLAVVFPLHRCDLRAGLRKYGQGRGLPLELVETYGKNIFMALRALRKVKVIHSDLKPENLLMSMDKASVKLADFGSAMDPDDKVSTDEAQPRYYRAPEVMLGHQYSTQIDVWSAGCTLYELATGKFLFTGETNNGMLQAMLKTCGAFSRVFATTGTYSSKHFSPEGVFRVREGAATKAKGASEVLLPMSDFPRPQKPLLQQLESNAAESFAAERGRQRKAVIGSIADLVARCALPEPEKRATPEAALSHRFFGSAGTNR